LADSDYTVNVGGNSVTLASGASAGDIVELEVFGNFAGQSGAEVSITGGSITGLTNFESAGIDDNASSTAMTLDSSGNVGIGTTGISSGVSADKLVIGNGASHTGLSVYSGTSSYGTLAFADASSGIGTYAGALKYSHSDNSLAVITNSTERMRIDSSGNLLVGKTAVDFVGTQGVYVSSTGQLGATKTSGAPLAANRLTTDGDIAQFYKDGTTVGSIGTYASRLTVGTGDTGITFTDSVDAIRPFNLSTNSLRAGAIDLGYPGVEFKDLYLSGGVYLGGTGSANKLDDYEEGSWTPSIVGNTGGTASLTLSSASYTKIGNRVLARFYMSASSGTLTGEVRVGGLPFTHVGVFLNSVSSSYVGCFNFDEGSISVGGFCRPSTSTVTLTKGSGTTTIDGSEFTGGAMMISIDYTTSS
jgi:hypothetical protein